MTGHKLLCPGCNQVLNVPKKPPLKGNCPKCKARFVVEADGRSRVLEKREAPRVEIDDEPVSAALPWGKIGLFGGIGGGAAIVLVILIVALGGKDANPAPDPKEPERPSFTVSGSRTEIIDDSKEPRGEAKGAGPEAVPAVATFKDGIGVVELRAKVVKTPAPVVIAAEEHPGVDQPAVNAAIDRGVAFLKTYRPKVPPGLNELGAEGLVGVTLLSCGVRPDDPAVRLLVESVRANSPGLGRTYELATCIWLLDKLKDPIDRELIRSMALRLIAGQKLRGGWDYTSPILNASQEAELLGLLQDQSLATKVPGKPVVVRTARDVSLPGLPVFSWRPGVRVSDRPSMGHEDNSLTQFALLALWRAKDYGVPVDLSLAFAQARFQESQADDGWWDYTWTAGKIGGRTDSMTCAGLMGIAVGKGSEVELLRKLGKPPPADKGPDPTVEKGLRHLGRRLQELGRVGAVTRPGSVGLGAKSVGDLYFLWSLERMAVVYGLRTVGDTDWYAWGVPYVLKSQREDGSWSYVTRLKTKATPFLNYMDTSQTCFALLFLRRANIAQDLTVALEGLSVTKDAGERQGSGGQHASIQGAAK